MTQVQRRFPRRNAGASLKPNGGAARLESAATFPPQKCGGLIEAAWWFSFWSGGGRRFPRRNAGASLKPRR